MKERSEVFVELVVAPLIPNTPPRLDNTKNTITKSNELRLR